MGKIVAAHQPNYLPWIGYFHKILKSDTFVILDHVEFSRRGFINRNRVKGPNGAVWLTVPVKIKGRTKIMNVLIDNSKDWKRKHVLTLRSFYAKAPYFDEIFPVLQEVYDQKLENLTELNIKLIMKIVNLLNLNTNFIRSSTLDPQGKKMDMILDICKKTGATIYLSGRGAMKYQDPLIFKENNIKLEYQDFEHPIYPQRFGEFISHLSIVDMLFNIGKEETKKILEKL